MLTTAALSLFFILQLPAESQNDDAKKMVTLRDFAVSGTRFPAASVVRLAGLHTGKQVNFLALHEALQKVTRTGLIGNIDFEYENYADKPDEVKLVMKCRDVLPLVPALIAIEGVEDEAVWKWLANIDPLFTRELPPNEGALQLYESWITKYLEANGMPTFSQTAIVRGETEGKPDRIERIVFKRIVRRAAPKSPKRP